MRKLQQFYVRKFSSGRLNNSNFDISRTFEECKKKKELVSLADSQVLRSLRMLQYEKENTSIENQYSKENLEKLMEKKKNLKKDIERTNSSEEIKKIKTELAETINQINKMLYIPQYILVTIENISHYRTMIKQGLYINGKKYVRLLCSAGMARNNTVAFVEDYKKENDCYFVNEEYFKEINALLKNDYDVKTPLLKHKYNAYYALSSTATHTVSTPNVLLIDDYEIKMTKDLDWVTDSETKGTLYNKDRIIKINKELSFNLFDGGGLIDKRKAEKWAKELELDYIPSVFIIRNIFVKGCLFTVDFQEFNKKIGHKETVVDVYGNEQKIEDVDIILTKSQFKLWNAYSSIEDYQKALDKNGNRWGIARVSPKEDDSFFTTNYQFLQVLNLDDNSVEELCKPTVDWLSKVLGLDRDYALLFLLGSLCTKDSIAPEDIFKMTSDNLVKALIINPEMINDEYIRQTIIYSINKKIKEAYIGKLIMQGNFSTMIPDLYAMMQHAFGLEVTGLLKEGEHYSQFWNKRNAKEGVGLRSPLTWRSEVNKMIFIQNEETEKWFKYCNSGIIFNVWGCDCIIHADSDFDGDLVATTNNEIFLKTRYDNLPISYNKKSAGKKAAIEDEKNLYKADIDSFNTKIGQITNYSTSMYELLYKFADKKDRYQEKCFNEIIERLKLTRKCQGDEIDAAKGVKSAPYPSIWINRQNILDEDDVSTKERKMFLNDIVADKKPYFFIYRYPKLRRDYNDFISRKSQIGQFKFKKSVTEIFQMTKEESDECGFDWDEIEKFKADYLFYSPVIDYDGPMNKVCHYIEGELEKLKIPQEIKDKKEEIISLLLTEDTVTPEEIKIFDDFCKRYFEEKKTLKMEKEGYIKKGSENVSGVALERYKKYLREEVEKEFVIDEHIANIVVTYSYVLNKRSSKSFAWEIFGDLIIQNLIKNTLKTTTITTVPKKSENGSIEYLFEKFEKVEVPIDGYLQ